MNAGQGRQRRDAGCTARPRCRFSRLSAKNAYLCRPARKPPRRGTGCENHAFGGRIGGWFGVFMDSTCRIWRGGLRVEPIARCPETFTLGNFREQAETNKARKIGGSFCVLQTDGKRGFPACQKERRISGMLLQELAQANQAPGRVALKEIGFRW